MNESMSINLIIQGPIYSPGVNGEGEKVEYTCVKNINKVLEEYGNLFKNVVLVTWKSEDISGIKKHKNFHIIQVEDIEEDFKNVLITEKVKRQLLSTWAGLNYLLTDRIKNTDLVVKLRTDQSLDLNLLLNESEILLEKGNDKIIVPCMDKNTRIYPADFYFVGSAKRMEKFLSQQLYSIFVFTNAHDSMVSNYHHNKNKMVSEFRKLVNLILWNERKMENQIYNNFNLFSKKLLTTCCWRGEYLKMENIQEYRFDFKCPKKFHLNYSLMKYKYHTINFYFKTSILDRKIAKSRLKRVTDIMENKNGNMIITAYKPH